MANCELPKALAALPFGSGYEAFGCAVNKIAVEDLFAKYASCGFLYPAKRARLEPFLPLIMENWRRSMTAGSGRFLHDVIVYDDATKGAWASITYWASANAAGHAQHLVSVGRPEASRAVMLPTQSVAHSREHRSSQNWFRAENRYPARVFGSCVRALGAESAAVHQVSCLTVPRERLPTQARSVQVERCNTADAPLLERLASRLCGSVQAQADEWADGDVELEHLNARYSEVGLRRFRRVLIATPRGMQEPAGLAVAYRGPLGLNFSFLENRCELWLDSNLDNERHRDVIASLIAACSQVYADFELPYLPITTDARTAHTLISQGEKLMQDYTRSVWLRSGYNAWYDHVDGFYSRLLAAATRRDGAAGGTT